MSPDGDAVAVRSDHPVDSTLAYGVLDMAMGGSRPKGSRWATAAEVSDWETLRS